MRRNHGLDQEGRLQPIEEARHEGAGAGGDGHGEERAGADFRHHQLDGEDDRAERRVERRRQSGGAAGRHQRHALPLRDAQQARQARRQRRADLDDRGFAPDRAAAAALDAGGQGFDEGGNGADAAFAIVDRVDDVRDPLPAQIRRQRPDEQHDRDPAHRGREDHQRPEPARGGVEGGVVIEGELAQEEYIVDAGNQSAEKHGRAAGEHAHDQGDERQAGEAHRPSVANLFATLAPHDARRSQGSVAGERKAGS